MYTDFRFENFDVTSDEQVVIINLESLSVVDKESIAECKITLLYVKIYHDCMIVSGDNYTHTHACSWLRLFNFDTQIVVCTIIDKPYNFHLKENTY